MKMVLVIPETQNECKKGSRNKKNNKFLPTYKKWEIFADLAKIC